MTCIDDVVANYSDCCDTVMYGRVKVGKINEDRHLYLWTDQTDNEKFELVIPKWRKKERPVNCFQGPFIDFIKKNIYFLT